MVNKRYKAGVMARITLCRAALFIRLISRNETAFLFFSADTLISRECALNFHSHIAEFRDERGL